MALCYGCVTQTHPNKHTITNMQRILVSFVKDLLDLVSEHVIEKILAHDLPRSCVSVGKHWTICIFFCVRGSYMRHVSTIPSKCFEVAQHRLCLGSPGHASNCRWKTPLLDGLSGMSNEGEYEYAVQTNLLDDNVCSFCRCCQLASQARRSYICNTTALLGVG